MSDPNDPTDLNASLQDSATRDVNSRTGRNLDEPTPADAVVETDEAGFMGGGGSSVNDRTGN